MSHTQYKHHPLLYFRKVDLLKKWTCEKFRKRKFVQRETCEKFRKHKFAQRETCGNYGTALYA